MKPVRRSIPFVVGCFIGACGIAIAVTFTPTQPPSPQSEGYPVPSPDPNWNQGFQADLSILDQPADHVGILEDATQDPETAAPLDDTAMYEFGRPDEVMGGSQTFGTMDKVGVHKSVNDAYPTIAADVAHIGDGTVTQARETFLVASGTPVGSDLTWNVRIWRVATVGTTERYVVSALLGKDPTTRSQDISHNGIEATLYELWERRDTEPPLLIRRSTKWKPEDTDDLSL